MEVKTGYNQILFDFFEASSLDRINMTENRLECDPKNFTPMNLNIGTRPKIYSDVHY